MLQSDGAVQQSEHRLALGLRVTMGHRDGGFFVQGRDELRHFVRSGRTVDDGFLNAFESRTCLSGYARKAEVAEGLHHEIRTGARDGARGGRRADVAGVARELLGRRRGGGSGVPSILRLGLLSVGLLGLGSRRRTGESGGSSSALKEVAAVHGRLLGFLHRVLLCFGSARRRSATMYITPFRRRLVPGGVNPEMTCRGK